jgi:carbon-monoxide dehydrogenase small subunit
VTVEFTLNGSRTRLDVPPHWTLLRMLRDAAGQTDVKHGCGEGVCGACAALVDDVAVNACSVLAPQVEGARVETAAGLAADGELHPLQAEMVSRGGVQCGFCTPGIVISAVEAVRIGAVGSEEEIRHSLAGNLCRCTGYGKIVASVAAYRDRAAGEPEGEPVPAEVGPEEQRKELGGEGAAPAPGVGPGP